MHAYEDMNIETDTYLLYRTLTQTYIYYIFIIPLDCRSVVCLRAFSLPPPRSVYIHVNTKGNMRIGVYYIPGYMRTRPAYVS